MNSIPKFSVVIPTRNEAETIVSTITRIQNTSIFYPTEIIIVDAGSTDKTVTLLQNYSHKIIQSNEGNRGAQMHLGALESRGEIVLFLHADTKLPENWQNQVVNALKNGQNAACAFDLRFDTEQFIFRVIEFFTRLRNRWTGIPHGDQALGIKRETYFSSGGYPSVPLMEEYLFYPKIKRLGRLTLLKEKVKTSPRKYLKKGPLRNVLRNFALILLFFLGMSPKRLAKLYD